MAEYYGNYQEEIEIHANAFFRVRPLDSRRTCGTVEYHRNWPDTMTAFKTLLTQHASQTPDRDFWSVVHTGYYGRPANVRHGGSPSSAVHLVYRPRGADTVELPLCGYRPHSVMQFQVNAMGVHLPYVECRRCRAIYNRSEWITEAEKTVREAEPTLAGHPTWKQAETEVHNLLRVWAKRHLVFELPPTAMPERGPSSWVDYARTVLVRLREVIATTKKRYGHA